MIEHGITTTKAEYWVHLHALEGMAFSYKVYRMREWAETNWAVTKLAQSKNKRITGAGFLVPKVAPFIWRHEIAGLVAVDWRGMTDREKKQPSEMIVMTALRSGSIRLQGISPLPIRVTTVENIEEQHAGIDCWLRFNYFGVAVEIKCDTHDETPNLFVQVAEGGHDPHTTRDGERRVTEF